MFRHLQKALREMFKQTPESCYHNAPVGLGASGAVHLCHVKVDGKPRKMLCDSRQWGGQRQARNCPLWQPKSDKDAIKAEFRRLMSGNRGEIAARYPDVAALMWVLDGAEGHDVGTLVEQVEDEADRELEANPPPPVAEGSDDSGGTT
jgi:hypothetical protein